MKITFNKDEKILKALREGLKRKNGYCPCKTELIDDNICMCREFRQ